MFVQMELIRLETVSSISQYDNTTKLRYASNIIPLKGQGLCDRMAFASVHITGLICIDDCLVGIPWCESLQVLYSHTVTYHPQIGGGKPAL